MRKLWISAAIFGLALGVTPQAGAQVTVPPTAPTQPAPRIVPNPEMPTNVILTARGNVFSPNVLTIKAGDTVTWMNPGGFHNVNGDDGSFRCSNGCDGDMNGGNGAPSGNPWMFSLAFDTPGIVPYFCEVHGDPGGRGMSGMIMVMPADTPVDPAAPPTGTGAPTAPPAPPQAPATE